MPSSVILNFRYDPGRRVLTVGFVSGQIYDYFDVPPEVYARMRAVTSKGRYFAAHVRDRYRFVRRAET